LTTSGIFMRAGGPGLTRKRNFEARDRAANTAESTYASLSVLARADEVIEYQALVLDAINHHG
jgi:hypothetical protein